MEESGPPSGGSMKFRSPSLSRSAGITVRFRFRPVATLAALGCSHSSPNRHSCARAPIGKTPNPIAGAHWSFKVLLTTLDFLATGRHGFQEKFCGFPAEREEVANAVENGRYKWLGDSSRGVVKAGVRERVVGAGTFQASDLSDSVPERAGLECCHDL